MTRKGMYYLTPREQEVLLLLTEGMTQNEVANYLGVSPHSIKNHLTNAFVRNDARSVLHLLAIIVGQELVEMETP